MNISFNFGEGISESSRFADPIAEKPSTVGPVPGNGPSVAFGLIPKSCYRHLCPLGFLSVPGWPLLGECEVVAPDRVGVADCVLVFDRNPLFAELPQIAFCLGTFDFWESHVLIVPYRLIAKATALSGRELANNSG